MLQVRVKHNDVWGEWADRSINIVLCAADMTNSRQWEVREKPEFEPGYFRKANSYGEPIHCWNLPPWDHHGTLMKESDWVRVEVTDVS